jgi:putative ATPase
MTGSEFIPLQAVTAGVGDIRKAALDAGERLKYYHRSTILFVDEIHRFNKSQQDVLLPFVEDGTLILIGATTENPLHELNNALLSRMKLYVLEALDYNSLERIITKAIKDQDKGLGRFKIDIDQESLAHIIQASQGDARTALNILDTLASSFSEADGHLLINADLVSKVTGKLIIKYDRSVIIIMIPSRPL